MMRRYGSGADVRLVIATIHGNESAGTPLVERLDEELRADPGCYPGRTILVIPVANPDGRIARRRTNARGIDLNRNFPAATFAKSTGHGETPLSEPESRAIAAVIEEVRPSLIVSIHQPLAVIDWNGDADGIAETMSRASGLPKKSLGTRPGSLGAWAGEEKKIPTITMELRAGDQQLPAETLWKSYGAALLAVLRTE